MKSCPSRATASGRSTTATPSDSAAPPPGFWEIHNGDPVTGVILQRLTETLDGGVVLHAGWFKTNRGELREVA